MTLHEHRGRFERTVTPVAAWCARRGIGPNEVTAVSMVITLAASVTFFYSSPARTWLLALGAGLLAIGAFLDSADGVLARMTDQATPLGDYLDHSFDRFADVALLLGLSFSPWVPLEIGVWAIAGTLLTSYMGTQAQAVGAGRDYGGLVGRADRMLILFIAPLLQVGLEMTTYTVPYGLNLVSLAMLWIAIAGNITALQRFWSSYKDLSEQT